MKTTILLFALMLAGKTQAQEITGSWFSADSSRVYAIQQTGNNLYEAVIKNSSRKADSIGFAVIKNLHYNTAKKRYEGIMYAVSDNQACFVKITCANNQLQLKLRRMFLFDALLQWNRAGENATASSKWFSGFFNKLHNNFMEMLPLGIKAR